MITKKVCNNKTRDAKNDLMEIIDYIANDKKDLSKSIYHKLKNKALTLSNMPLKGRIVPELKIFSIDIYREIIENPWRIIYRVQDKEVIILAVIDGRRNIEDIIFEKLLGK